MLAAKEKGYRNSGRFWMSDAQFGLSLLVLHMSLCDQRLNLDDSKRGKI